MYKIINWIKSINPTTIGLIIGLISIIPTITSSIWYVAIPITIFSYVLYIIIRKKYLYIKERVINYRRKHRVFKYLKSGIGSSNELYISCVIKKKHGILIKSHKGPEFTLDDAMIELFDKYKLDKFKNRLPIGLSYKLFEVMTDSDINIGDFTSMNRRSEYINKKFIDRIKVPNLF